MQFQRDALAHDYKEAGRALASRPGRPTREFINVFPHCSASARVAQGTSRRIRPSGGAIRAQVRRGRARVNDQFNGGWGVQVLKDGD